MIPYRLQYFLGDFWNFQKRYQIWTLGPRIDHQNISKNTSKSRSILENIYVAYLGIWNFESVGRFVYRTVWKNWIWNLENLKIWNLTSWTCNFEILKIWTMDFLKCGLCTIVNSKFEKWGIWKCKFGSLEIWKSCVPQVLSNVVKMGTRK